MPGAVIWTVLMSRKVHDTIRLYEAVLGWQFEKFAPSPFPGWIGRGRDGAIMAIFIDANQSDFPASPEMWVPCMALENLEQRVEEAEAQGATLLRAPLEIPRFGRIALLRQPGGAVVGWMTPAADPIT